MSDVAKTAPRPKIGEILVGAGTLSQENLQTALDEQKESKEKLGFVLLKNRYISEAQLVQALSRQLSIPWVSLTHLQISQELMNLVPRDIVVDHGVVPIYVMSKRPGEKVLYVAMDDPTNEELLQRISNSSGIGVRPMIAAPSEIATAIRRFYRTKWNAGEKLIEMIKAATGSDLAPCRQETDTKPPEIGEEAFLLPETAIVMEMEAAVATEEEEAIVLPQEAQIEEEPLVGTQGMTPDAEAHGREEIAAMEGEEAPALTAPLPPLVQEAAPKPVLSFTLLNGTKITLRSDGPTTTSKTAEQTEQELLGRIVRTMKKDRSGTAAALAVARIVEILMGKGLATPGEIEELVERMEKR